MKSKTCFCGSGNRMSNSKITFERCRLCYGDEAVGDREAAEIKLLFILLLCIHSHTAAVSQIFLCIASKL